MSNSRNILAVAPKWGYLWSHAANEDYEPCDAKLWYGISWYPEIWAHAEYAKQDLLPSDYLELKLGVCKTLFPTHDAQ